MATLLDLSPDTAHPVLSGAAEIEQTLDRIQAGASMPFGAGDCAAAVQALERVGRRVEAVKLKLLAAADKTGDSGGCRVHRHRRLGREAHHRLPGHRSP